MLTHRGRGALTATLSEFVVIDHDDNSEPLVEAMTDAGIARDRIILAYAGEPALCAGSGNLASTDTTADPAPASTLPAQSPALPHTPLRGYS
jgi:hypothetical protein